jgi:hypothetical protein
MSHVNISGIDKYMLAVALRSASNAPFFTGQGLPAPPLNSQKLRENIESGDLQFDYLDGYIMKVDLSGEEVDSRLYDRDNGTGALQKAVDDLRRRNSMSLEEWSD